MPLFELEASLLEAEISGDFESLSWLPLIMANLQNVHFCRNFVYLRQNLSKTHFIYQNCCRSLKPKKESVLAIQFWNNAPFKVAWVKSKKFRKFQNKTDQLILFVRINDFCSFLLQFYVKSNLTAILWLLNRDKNSDWKIVASFRTQIFDENVSKFNA